MVIEKLKKELLGGEKEGTNRLSAIFKRKT
jgi:hypothetical protein